MGVDLKTFEPEYEILESRGKVVSELKKLAKDAPEIYLATDLDREGEAIAWHLKKRWASRTSASSASSSTPSPRARSRRRSRTRTDRPAAGSTRSRRGESSTASSATRSRRCCGRRSPRAFRAGRVQSVAVRLVVEREREIDAFTPAEYWTIGSIFTTKQRRLLRAERQVDRLPDQHRQRRAHQAREEKLAERTTTRSRASWSSWPGKKFEATNKDQARQAAELLGFVVDEDNTPKTPTPRARRRTSTSFSGHLDNCPKFIVRSIEKKRTTSKPPAPFITSTLQQAASVALGFRRAEDDACRPDAVRGRLHHLHAYRLDQPLARGVGDGALVHQGRVRRPLRAGEAELSTRHRTRARRKPTRRSARPMRTSPPNDAHDKLGPTRASSIS
jgi:DNA topoisomerase-1